MINGINGPDLVTRSYIRRQLNRNQLTAYLENEYNIFSAKNLHLPEVERVNKFLESKGLPCVSFFTFKTENVYEEHFLFYFTHVNYYRFTQLIEHNSAKLRTTEILDPSTTGNISRIARAEIRRLEDKLSDLVLDLKADPDRLWKDPSFVFLFSHEQVDLPPSNLNVYRFEGVSITTPTKICYLE